MENQIGNGIGYVMSMTRVEPRGTSLSHRGVVRLGAVTPRFRGEVCPRPVDTMTNQAFGADFGGLGSGAAQFVLPVSGTSAWGPPV